MRLLRKDIRVSMLFAPGDSVKAIRAHLLTHLSERYPDAAASLRVTIMHKDRPWWIFWKR